MKITPDQGYKLVETDGFLAIIPTNTNIAGTDSQPLIIADKEKLCDYLMAYLSQREEGKALKEAHNSAMAYLGVTEVRR